MLIAKAPFCALWQTAAIVSEKALAGKIRNFRKDSIADVPGWSIQYRSDTSDDVCIFGILHDRPRPETESDCGDTRRNTNRHSRLPMTGFSSSEADLCSPAD